MFRAHYIYIRIPETWVRCARADYTCSKTSTRQWPPSARSNTPCAPHYKHYLQRSLQCVPTQNVPGEPSFAHFINFTKNLLIPKPTRFIKPFFDVRTLVACGDALHKRRFECKRLISNTRTYLQVVTATTLSLQSTHGR